VTEFERNLKKLKKKSTGLYKGGWGTFTVAFEDKDWEARKKAEPVVVNTKTSFKTPKPKSIPPTLESVAHLSDVKDSPRGSTDSVSNSVNDFDN